MEELNKNQIVLLTLLVSFVTSIATGIMTTSLLQQAPIEVTRNINRIVEKTIETVTPVTPSSPTIQKEVTTVVVKEEDQIIDSINKNSETIVRIKERNPFTDETSFYGIGVLISKDGLVATDRKSVTNTHIYTGTLSDGTTVLLSPLAIDKQTNFILFKAAPPEKLTDKEKDAYVFKSVVISGAEPKLGQSMISVGGEVQNAVSVGRATSVQTKEAQVASSTVKYISTIETDVATRDLVVGTPIYNLSGEFVGMRLSNNSLRFFTSVDVLKRELSTINETPKN